jgi:membrane associated rhomboid family serine protease
MSIYDRDYMRDNAPGIGERLRQASAFHWFFWANIIVFVAQWVFRIGLDQHPLTGEYLPSGSVSLESIGQGRVWTVFTYMFVHGSAGHILVNMIMLWFAGKRVQDLYGPRHFVLIYLLSGIAGALFQILLSSYVMHDSQITLIGASASVMGLLLAYAVAMPEERITLLLAFIIPIRARLWGMAKFLLLINVAFGVLDMLDKLPAWLSGGGGHVAYFAHVGGALAGWYYARSIGHGARPFDLNRPRRSNEVRRRRAMVHARPAAIEIERELKHENDPEMDLVIDLMRDEVDPILDKISDFGITSLTDEERRILERASRHISRNNP